MSKELNDLNATYSTLNKEADIGKAENMLRKIEGRVNQLNTYQLVPMANLLSQTSKLYVSLIDLFKKIGEENIFDYNSLQLIKSNPIVASAIATSDIVPNKSSDNMV